MITSPPYLYASAKVAGDHRSILREDFPAAADTVHETVAAHGLEGC